MWCWNLKNKVNIDSKLLLHIHTKELCKMWSSEDTCCYYALWFAPSKTLMKCSKHQQECFFKSQLIVLTKCSKTTLWQPLKDDLQTPEMRLLLVWQWIHPLSHFYIYFLWYTSAPSWQHPKFRPWAKTTTSTKCSSLFILFFFFSQEQHDLYNFIKGRSLKHASFYQITTKIMKFLPHWDKQTLYLNARLKLPSWKEKSKPHAGLAFIIMRQTCA